MKAKEILIKYLESAISGHQDLSKYYAEKGILIDFRKNIYSGLSEIKAFYQQPMPPGFELVIEKIEEESSMIARAIVSVSSRVFESFQMIEKLELNTEGKIVKFEMLAL